MDILMVIMRLLHIVLGAFWVGALVFAAFFLGPAVRDAGPDGARVMGGLIRRRFMDVMPAVAILTILSGFWLYWRVSAGFQPAYMGSRPGIAIGIGAVAALAAFAVGVGVVRPSMLKAVALAQADGADPATLQELRARGAGAARIVAILLLVAVGAMAIARYL